MNMNMNLNQIIFEGVVVKNVEGNFDLENTRRYKSGDDEEVVETTTLTIVTYGALKEYCCKVRKGTFARVVGLVKKLDDEFVIVAEHIDFPFKSNK